MGHRETRPGVLPWALSTVLLLAACGVQEQPPQGAHAGSIPSLAKRPDIVLVSIDSLRFDHLGCYGYPKPTSPGIDRLASDGVRFRNAVSTTSWTLPAHAALFTGLWDGTHGLVDNGLRLSDSVVTLAEALRGAGYQTAGFYGGPYLHPTYGLAQGFETYVSCMTKLRDDLPQNSLRAVAEGDTNVSHRDITGPRTVQRVEEWLGGVDDRPLFLFLHLWDVHYDYIPPAEYVQRFDPGYPGSLTGDDVMHDPAVHRGMPKRDLEHLVALYDGEVRFTDDNLGRILAEIDRRGRLDSALVVVTSDHGEEFFEHGGKGHQRTLYEEVLRIPLVFRWRGKIAPGRVVEDQVRIIDIMPTVLTLAGVAPPAAIQGRDLGPLLRGEPLDEVPALAELHVPTAPRLDAVRTNRSKLISFPTPRWWQIGAQYFDLERDPGEREVLSPWSLGFLEATWTLRSLRRDAKGLRERLGETSVAAPEADPEVLERLRSLGYLDGGTSSRPSAMDGGARSTR